jgi:hypothetical protein
MWLAKCLQKHQLCKKSISGINLDDTMKAMALPTRVIEVGTETKSSRPIVSNGRFAQYVALSYC